MDGMEPDQLRLESEPVDEPMAMTKKKLADAVTYDWVDVEALNHLGSLRASRYIFYQGDDSTPQQALRDRCYQDLVRQRGGEILCLYKEYEVMKAR